jgi:hypothetical protein
MASSPTFIAHFVDGHETRMTVYHDAEHKTLDLKRGVMLARYAYTSRAKGEPCAIVSATFVLRGENGADDTVLAEYTADQIKEAVEPTAAKHGFGSGVHDTVEFLDQATQPAVADKREAIKGQVDLIDYLSELRLSERLP